MTNDSFLATISLYDFSGKYLKTFKNVPIPEVPTWKTDLDCLHYLERHCKGIEFNGVYAIQPYHNSAPLKTLRDAIYPKISPEMRSAEGWDLKLMKRGVDISASSQLAKIESTLDSLSATMESLNSTMESMASILMDLRISLDDDFAIVHPLSK
ncbi:hypothetical protein CJU89_4351 [Yarrowia sp. B02]|nr:hypothetical protein CJU89_4351 [Yarrowia sp. B02]